MAEECWKAESPAFRAEVELAFAKEHETAVEGYKVALAKDTPTTAEEYNIALENAAFYLQPFADACHAQYGMNVSILMCGPILEHGGRLEMRRCLTPRVWSEYDRAGFEAVQRSFIGFTQKCFTEEECRARALQDCADEAHDSEETNATSAATKEPAGSKAILPLSPSMPEALMISMSDLLFGGDKGNNSLFGSDGLLNSESVFQPWDGFYEPYGLDVPDYRGPIVGQALGVEIAAMSHAEGLAYMGRLATMTLEEVDKANCAADARAQHGLGPITPTSAMEQILVIEGDGTAQQAPDTVADVIVQQPPKPRAAWRGAQGAAAAVAGGEEAHAAGTTSTLAAATSDAATSDAATAAAVSGGEENAHNTGTSDVERAAAAASAAVGGQAEEDAHRTEVATGAAVDGEEPRVDDTAGKTDKGGGYQRTGHVWEQADEEQWPAELKMVFQAFQRARKFGGVEWEFCVEQFIALERARGFPAKGTLAVPQGNAELHPEEIPAFIQCARKWEKDNPLISAPGPIEVQGSFAKRWWDWWVRVQPESRTLPSGKLMSSRHVDVEEWEDISQMAGRNGMLLYVGALLWWGEAAASAEEGSEALLKEWKIAVVDMGSVLAMADRTGSPAAADEEDTSAKGASGRHKRKERPSSSNKENVPAKRRRST
ncbi:hypothetical protein K438DRAFT_1787092 [Mycena galopus ATCC 62051]|nr:hypothetical protein K438DRAFT_1787092 [Mycena galopus ATCC 62051]